MFKMPFSGLFIWRTFTSLEWLAQRKYQGRKHGQPQDGFPTEMDVPASVLSPQTPNLRQKYSLGNTQAFATLSGANCWDCPRAGTVPTASLQLPISRAVLMAQAMPMGISVSGFPRNLGSPNLYHQEYWVLFWELQYKRRIKRARGWSRRPCEDKLREEKGRPDGKSKQ